MIAAAAVTSADAVVAVLILAGAAVLAQRLHAGSEWVARILGQRRPARRTIVARSHAQRRPRSTPPYDWSKTKENNR